MLDDLGTHAHHLARYISGLEIEQVSADLSILVAGRQSHDNAQVSLRFQGGARGALWVSFVAAGARAALRFRIYGETGGMEWFQEEPELLHLRQQEGSTLVLRRGGPWLSDAARHVGRLESGPA